EGGADRGSAAPARAGGGAGGAAPVGAGDGAGGRGAEGGGAGHRRGGSRGGAGRDAGRGGDRSGHDRAPSPARHRGNGGGTVGVRRDRAVRRDEEQGLAAGPGS